MNMIATVATKEKRGSLQTNFSQQITAETNLTAFALAIQYLTQHQQTANTKASTYQT